MRLFPTKSPISTASECAIGFLIGWLLSLLVIVGIMWLDVAPTYDLALWGG